MSLTDAHIATLALARQIAAQKVANDDEMVRLDRWRQMAVDMMRIADYKDDNLSPEQRLDLMAERKKRYIEELKASGPHSEGILAHIQQTEKEINALKEARDPTSEARKDLAAYNKFLEEDVELNKNPFFKELKTLKALRKDGRLSAEGFDRESDRLIDTYVLDPEKKKVMDEAMKRMSEQAWMKRIGLDSFDPELAGRERLQEIEKRNAARSNKGSEARPQTVADRVSAFLQGQGKDPLRDDSGLVGSATYASSPSNHCSKIPLGPATKSDGRSPL